MKNFAMQSAPLFVPKSAHSCPKLPETTHSRHCSPDLAGFRPFRLVFLIVLLCSVVSGTLLADAVTRDPARPNFLIILADDMGFSDIGCYGGEIATPNIDRLAAGGVRFTQFYNTARCWPTRTAILTGYYPQQVRMDPPDRKRGLPTWTRLLPHYLKPLGYRSYQSGKWHIMGAPNIIADGGFDRSYEATDQDRYFSPMHYRENDQRLGPIERDSGYYATTAFADHAIRCLKEHAEKYPDQPFFSYLAFISPHFPLHALQEDIDRYRDEYLEGWDVVRKRRWERLKELGIVDSTLREMDSALTPRYFKPEFLEELGPGEVKHAVAWETLTSEQKRFQATKMAIHAAMVDRMDQEIGRVLDQLREMGELENTVVFFLSDNGADATLLIRGDRHDPAAPPGSAASYLTLGPGWATASNSPFHRHKIWTHEGGISTPLIVHWPRGLEARGELRHAAGHVTDLTPTVLELASAKPTDTWNGAKPPPLPGRSLVPAIKSDAPTGRELVFFHHEGNRALRVGDWKIVSASEEMGVWELYDLSKDRGETMNLAAKHPDRVREMAARWEALEAEYRAQSQEP